MESKKNMKMIAAILMMVCIVVADAQVDCGLVSKSVAPCIGYLRGGALTSQCCDGIKVLNSKANTPIGRRTACSCLKAAATSISGINFGLAAGLPGKCGVSIPYKISPSTDCSRVN